MQLPALEIKQASFAYQQVTLFQNLGFTLFAGQWVGLLGPSGIGKSTLLRLMAGLMPLTSGSITTHHQSALATQIAYMAQTDLLLPWFSVLDNALLSEKLKPSNQLFNKKKQALHLLKSVGLENVTHHYPHTLSGGMRQRVALVRTLLMDKPIILMDEPFSALDAITRYQLQAIAAEILQGKTVFFITHDPLEALRLASDIYIMHGLPAQIKKVATLSSAIPRDLNDPQLIHLQAVLYEELLLASGNKT